MTDKMTAYCTCGASVELVGCSKECVYAILQEWHTAHHGPGHGDTDEATARRAREAGAEAEAE